MTYLIMISATFAKSEYSRKEFGQWRDDNRNCLNTRAEVLKKRSLIDVTMDGCRVIKGKWDDFYYKETLTLAKLIDIDHVVPVKHAFDTGAHSWSKKKKRAFYNDEDNLVVTNRKYNRKKQSKDITSWLPVDRDYACRYANKWMFIKKKYELTITQEETDVLKLLKCPTFE